MRGTRARDVIALTAASAVLLSAPAMAKDLFQLNLDVVSPTTGQAAASASTITNLINTLQTQNLSALTSAYTGTSAASALLNIRGVTAYASFPNSSTTLTFSMPSAGVNVSFTGATRNDSEQDLLNFLKNGGSVATRILQQMVAHSPIDPVAGNPASLENSMAAADFSIGTGIGLDGVETPQPGPNGTMQRQPNLFAVGGDIGVVNTGGYSSTVVTLPLRYTIPFADPRYALTLDMPISYINTQGATSFYGSFGASLRIPVISHWYLTPSVRAGAGGSVDLGAASLEYSAGLASRYDIYIQDLKLTIGNGISVIKTGPLSIGTVNVNYNLTNEAINNGLQAEGSLPYKVFGQPTSWQAYLVDTVIAGSPVYIGHYDEIGFTVGTRHAMNSQDWDSLRAGFGVAVGEHFNAYKAGFTYRF